MAMSTGMKLGSLVDEETATVGRERAPRSGGGGGGLRAALNSSGAKVVVSVAVVVILAFAGMRILGVARSNALIRGDIRYMHAESGELRWYKVGQPPAEGFHPVEYCFQNTCGPDGGTPVILNGYLGVSGPTQCPKCGARVVGHNPRPEGYEEARPKDWDR